MKTKRFCAGAAALCLALTLCACGGKSGEKAVEVTPDPTVPPQVTVPPTAEPSPTVSPAPTAAPVPSPTPTPAPTPVPTPEPAEEPVFTTAYRAPGLTDLLAALTDSASVLVTDYGRSDEGFRLELYLLNEGEEELEFILSELCADGRTLPEKYSYTVPAGCGGTVRLLYPAAELEATGKDFLSRFSFVSCIREVQGEGKVLFKAGTTLNLEV